MVVVVAKEVCALGVVDELLVRVVVTEVDIGLFLDCGVDPTVVNTKGNQVDSFARDRSRRDTGILFLDVRGEFGAIVSTI